MTREEKNQVIDRLSGQLSDNANFYLADISELTVEDSGKLRRKCFEQGVSVEVVKNTLLKKALEKQGSSYEELYEILAGPTSIMFSETANTPAKIIKEFRKTHEKPVLKAAYIEETFYVGDDQLTMLATLKSKDELIADVIALLQSPVKNVVAALESGKNTLSGLVKALEDKPAAPAGSAEAKTEPAPEAKAEEGNEPEVKEEKQDESGEEAGEDTKEENKE